MNDLPSHEEIEKLVLDQSTSIIGRLRDTTESRSAKRHIDLAYGYAKEARERDKSDRTEDVPIADASVSLRSPLLPDWPGPWTRQERSCGSTN